MMDPHDDSHCAAAGGFRAESLVQDADAEQTRGRGVDGRQSSREY